MNSLKNKSKLSLPVIFQKIEDVDSEDKRFTKVKIWLMHLGQNFNGSIFEKDVVDAAIPTLQYIPIVGFIDENSLGEEDFSQHKYVLVRKNGELDRKYIGVPYGVILSNEDNNAHYEDRLCDDGVTRTFLVVDGLIWNMFDVGSDIINRDLIKNHSMELWDDDDSIEGYEDEDGIFHWTKFTFRAACILGKDYEPGMINSTIEVQFTLNDFVRDFQSELNNKLAEFAKIQEQGGKSMPSKTDFAQTVMELFSDIASIIKDYDTVSDYWGDSVPRYYLHDIQDDEAIVVDKKNNYQYYAFKFTIDGDKPVIDFDSCIRKKTKYEDYVEGTTVPNGQFSFDQHISEFESSVTNKIDALKADLDEAKTNYEKLDADYKKLNSDYETVSKDFAEIKPKYDEFVKAAEDAEAQKIEAAKDTVFQKFDIHLSDNEQYEEIKKNRDNLTSDEIYGQCSILFTKKTLEAKTDFSKGKSNKQSIISDIMDDIGETDGYVTTKYGDIPLNK